MSPDPVERAAPYSSPYVFVSDNPINYIDGNGRFKIRFLFGLLAKGVHERITKTALATVNGEGISNKLKSNLLVRGVRRADIQAIVKDWLGHKGLEYHFDNMEDEQAIKKGWNNVQERINSANDLLAEGDNRGASKEYGLIAHTVQDFYAHSNYVEIASQYYDNFDEIPLYDEVMNNPDAYDPRFIEDLEKNLYSGHYGSHEDFTANSKDERSHGKTNKDSGVDTPINNPKFGYAGLAEELATKATQKLFRGERFTNTNTRSNNSKAKPRLPRYRHKDS
jgi:hypothetical protein